MSRSSAPPPAPTVLHHVRLSKAQALELNFLAREESLDDAERRLRMIRPDLSPDAAHEVAWRCADPMTRGGIVTGVDPTLGEYADVAVTI